jgi:hypothetical protein
MKVRHIISLAAFYLKRMQDMNISIAFATPLRYLPQNDDVNTLGTLSSITTCLETRSQFKHSHKHI